MSRLLAAFALTLAAGAFAGPRIVLFEEFTNTS